MSLIPLFLLYQMLPLFLILLCHLWLYHLLDIVLGYAWSIYLYMIIGPPVNWYASECRPLDCTKCICCTDWKGSNFESFEISRVPETPFWGFRTCLWLKLVKVLTSISDGYQTMLSLNLCFLVFLRWVFLKYQSIKQIDARLQHGFVDTFKLQLMYIEVP